MMTKINFKSLTYSLICLTSANDIFFLYRFFQQQNGFILGDWLINYQGGLTRRGLFGEMIINLSYSLNLNLIYVSFFIVSIIYILFIFFLIKIISKSNINFLTTLIIFSPAALLFNFYDPLAVGRKEILFLLFFSIYLLFRHRLFFKYLAPLLSIIITLSHELLFFLLPFFFISRYLEVKNFNIKEYISEFIIAVSCTVTNIILLLYSDPNIATMCNAVREFGLNGNNACWAINTMTFAPVEFKSYVRDIWYLRYYPIFFILIAIPILICLKRLFNLNYFFSIILLLISVIPISSLFLIVNDWGRYLNIYSLFWMMLLISKNPKINLVKINFVHIFIIFLLSISWYMPHCCPKSHFDGIMYKPGIYQVYDRIKIRIINKRLN